MIRLGLLLFFLTMLSCSTLTYNPASLASIRHQQTQLLYKGCMRYQFDSGLHYYYAAGDVTHTCRDWARERVKGPFDH